MKILYLLSSLKTFFSYLILLQKSRNKNICEIEDWQFRELKKTICFAWDNIPFYRQYWTQAGFEPSMFKSLSDMDLIPFTDKNTVREHREELLNPKYPKDRLTMVTTGGTTGMPMKFYIDNYFSRGKEFAFGYWCSKHYWGYLNRIARIAILRGFEVDKNKIQSGIFWQKSRRDNGLVFSSFHISETTYNLYLNRLRTYRPKYIKAYPSSIVSFCTLMKRNGDYGINGLKAVICSSENIYDSHRQLIRETLGVEILSYYGHSEKAVSAFQSNGKMLFQPHYGYTEFLDNEYRPVTRKGDIAQVVVTSLNNRYFPFIRYKTDDQIVVDDYRLKTAQKIIGRSQEFIIDRNGDKILFTCADEIFWNLDGVVAYQYIQNEKGRLILNIQINTRFKDEYLAVIENSVREMFFNFEISVHVVDSIEKTKAGKFRYLIQNIKMEVEKL